MNNALLSLPKAAVAVATAAVLACGPAPAASARGSGMAAATTENVVNRPHTVGRWLVDDSGRVVTFHGENIVNKRAPWTPQALGIGEDDAAFLAKQGFNSVRLGISWAAIEPQPGQYNDAYLAEIKQAIETFNSYGISTFLEYHQDFYTESLGGEGAPPRTA